MQNSISHNPNWAQTELGTPIELYSSSVQNQAPYLFIGGVHGDEPEGVRLATDFLNWLKSEATDLPHIHSWYLIPCINPDGYKRNQRTNSRGVDLNRNFPSSDWSPEAKAERYYPGEKPNSEKETQALVQLIEKIKPKLIVHFHSWEPCVVYTGKAGQSYAEIIAKDSPYEAKEDIGYPTPGSLGQYGMLNCKIPVVCIEEQEKIDLKLVWPHFKNGLIRLITTKDGI